MLKNKERYEREKQLSARLRASASDESLGEIVQVPVHQKTTLSSISKIKVHRRASAGCGSGVGPGLPDPYLKKPLPPLCGATKHSQQLRAGVGQRINLGDIERSEQRYATDLPWQPTTEFPLDRNDLHQKLFRPSFRHSMDSLGVGGYLLKPNFLLHSSRPGHYEKRDNQEVQELRCGEPSPRRVVTINDEMNTLSQLSVNVPNESRYKTTTE